MSAEDRRTHIRMWNSWESQMSHFPLTVLQQEHRRHAVKEVTHVAAASIEDHRRGTSKVAGADGHHSVQECRAGRRIRLDPETLFDGLNEDQT